MQRFLGVVIAVVLAAGVVAVVINNLPEREKTVPVNETRLRPGQTEVTGKIAVLRADAAVPTEPVGAPITIRTGKATISNALVDGKPSAIVWDGGRPFVMSGDGSIDVTGAPVEVDAAGVRWTLDGTPRAINPGGYRINTPVAVGASGLARPRATVNFTADDKTAIATSGNARIERPLAPMTIEGPGTVRLEGQLRVRTPNDDGTAQPTFSGQGAYRITLTPTPDGIQVVALFQQG